MANKIPFLSVIVPVYRSADRIENCINSILKQTYKEFELILVDDGSDDGSALVCDKYAEIDSRIMVIHKVNGGVSSARNVGLECSRGKIVTFVDSDDHIDEIFFEKAIDIYKNEMPELLMFGLNMETWSEDELVNQTFYGIKEKTKLDVKTLLERCLDDIPLICLCCTYCKFFIMDIIKKNNIMFDCSLSLGEDTNFCLDYCKHVKNILFESQGYYHYFRGNSDSLFSRFHEEIYEVYDKVYSKMEEMMRKEKCSEKSTRSFEAFCIDRIIGSVQSYYMQGDKICKDKKIKQIKKAENNRYIQYGHYHKHSVKMIVLLVLLRFRFTYLVHFIFSLYYWKR